MSNRIKKRAISVILLVCMIASIYGTVFYVSGHEIHQCTGSHCNTCVMVKEGNDYLNRFSSIHVEAFFQQNWLKDNNAQEQTAYLNPALDEQTLVLLSIRMNC